MSSKPFPSLMINASEILAQGSFAEAQAEYLSPDPDVVAALDALLSEKKIGVVAHFYMDPELQGVLSACSWPQIQISDSLAMADAATRMVEAGCESIVVLGVDFMSENARALLDAAGHSSVPVYRVAEAEIGCSLAESAESLAYGAYLTEGARRGRALHVVYINTSLQTKAQAHALIPTLTCTSGNVVKTVLAAFAQIPDLHVYFGPDTYMGQNLYTLFEALSKLDSETVSHVHPEHDRASLRALLPRFHYFQQGTCIVHQMFGQGVADRLREEYGDALITAHLEVPGAMFEVALEAREQGRGVVGSTSDLLAFIGREVDRALAAGQIEPVRVVLGTEAGMITAIVGDVRRRLSAVPGSALQVEVIFPVAADAITPLDDSELPVVPGVHSGEGCTVAGGCATCPFMKMNSLDALLDLGARIGGAQDLTNFHPRAYDNLIDGQTAAALGSQPIVHMRAFQQAGCLSEELIEDVLTRKG